jgi:nitrite reductase (NO-forming)
VVWSEHFAEALLHARAGGTRIAMVRLAALNVAVVAVLAGVHGGRTALVAGGGTLLAVVVLAHAAALFRRIRHALPTRLGDTVWFYVAAATALVAATGLGMLLAGDAAGSGDAYRAIRLAHAHLNVLGWIGLSVLGTQFTLWPTVLRTRMAGSVRTAARWSFLLSACGLAVAAAGLLARQQAVAVGGLAGYAAGLGTALWPFAWTLRQRRPHNAASWMLAAGMTWFTVAVAADLAAVATAPAVVDLDLRIGRLVPVVAVGFGLQVLTGALTYLLPAVWGRGAHGNRTLTRILELGWPARVAALNAGVAAVAAGAAGHWVTAAGQVLIGLALGSFAILAAAALAWRVRNRMTAG